MKLPPSEQRPVAPTVGEVAQGFHLARLMTEPEVAQACRVSCRLVRSWRAAGLLRPVRLPGRVVRYSLATVRAFLEGDAA